jgi:rubrerythrin
MNLQNRDTTRVLEYAIEREIETRDFYRSCLERTNAEGVKEIFKGLVEDEQRHHDILQRLLYDITKGETPSVEMQQSEAARVRLERAFTRVSLDDPNFAPERQNVRGVLDKALEVEKESFTNYSEAAEDCEVEDVRAVYRFLAGEENKHYIIIENLMSYLDVPGRWLYYEENLVFQNG